MLAKDGPGFLSSYLNLLRKDVYKAYKANEGEISAYSWGVETLSKNGELYAQNVAFRHLPESQFLSARRLEP
jgi:hypothetical protein